MQGYQEKFETYSQSTVQVNTSVSNSAPNSHEQYPGLAGLSHGRAHQEKMQEHRRLMAAVRAAMANESQMVSTSVTVNGHLLLKPEETSAEVSGPIHSRFRIGP
jgi:hypothetical protein